MMGECRYIEGEYRKRCGVGVCGKLFILCVFFWSGVVLGVRYTPVVPGTSPGSYVDMKRKLVGWVQLEM